MEECIGAGLVRGEELFFDATKVEANASLDSAGSRALVEHLAGIFPEDASVVVGAESAAADAEVGRALAQENAGRHRWIAQNGR